MSGEGSPGGEIRLKLFGRTDVGQIREHNEDNFLIADLTRQSRGLMENERDQIVGPSGTVFAVCDGMGGAAAGEVASKLAIDIIYGIIDPDRSSQRVPTVSCTLGETQLGLTPQQIARRLDQDNIFVWDGNFYALAVTERLGLEDRGGLLRIGLVHYNTTKEVDILLGHLADMPNIVER